ncbi:hypothetical protein [Streptomyces sp. NPDC093591]|uniref:hypothetical protein n=1 Tax=Streptomyces sp. NPDC093591 TaxID=3366044 RepID=UPI00381572EC
MPQEYQPWDLPQTTARTYPYASADDMAVQMNRFSLALLLDDPLDANQPDGTAEAARELIVVPGVGR